MNWFIVKCYVKINFLLPYIAASTETVRSCPLCRKFSPYVIPSLYFVKSRFYIDNQQKIEFHFCNLFHNLDSKAKEKLQQLYLNNTASKRCKYWSGKPGEFFCKNSLF